MSQVLETKNQQLIIFLKHYDFENLTNLRKGLLQLLERSQRLTNENGSIWLNDFSYTVFELLETLLENPMQANDLTETHAALMLYISEKGLSNDFEKWFSDVKETAQTPKQST